MELCSVHGVFFLNKLKQRQSRMLVQSPWLSLFYYTNVCR